MLLLLVDLDNSTFPVAVRKNQRWNMKTFAVANITTDTEANNEPSLRTTDGTLPAESADGSGLSGACRRKIQQTADETESQRSAASG